MITSLFLSVSNLNSINIAYQFKCPQGECFSLKVSIYISLAITTLSRRLTLHQSDTSFILQTHEKHIHNPPLNTEKF